MSDRLHFLEECRYTATIHLLKICQEIQVGHNEVSNKQNFFSM